MSKGGLDFASAEECELFMARYLSPDYEGRIYVKPSHVETVTSIEQSSNAASSWRLADGQCRYLIQSFSETEEYAKIKQYLANVEVSCGGCKVTNAASEIIGIKQKFTNDDPGDDISPAAKQHLDIILCLLSSAVDHNDLWSITRYFSRINPAVLPPLRRLSQQTNGHLNIMSVLLSYVINAHNEKNNGSDAVLSSNFISLKTFVDTVFLITDKLQEDTSGAREAVRSMVEQAAKHLLSIDKNMEKPDYERILAIATKHLTKVYNNLEAMKGIFANSYQKKPRTCSDAHILAVSFRDRLVCLDVMTKIGNVSPLFNFTTPEAQSSSRTAFFVNSISREDDENKENLYPGTFVLSALPGKDVDTSARPKRKPLARLSGTFFNAKRNRNMKRGDCN